MNEKDVKKNLTEWDPVLQSPSNPESGLPDIFNRAVDDGSGIDVCFTKIEPCGICLNEPSM